MKLLFKYDFANSTPRTIKEIADSISPPAGYYGFDRVYVALAAGSGPATMIQTGGPTLPLEEKKARSRAGQAYDGDWLSNVTVTPGTGSSWSIFVCLIDTLEPAG